MNHCHDVDGADVDMHPFTLNGKPSLYPFYLKATPLSLATAFESGTRSGAGHVELLLKAGARLTPIHSTEAPPLLQTLKHKSVKSVERLILLGSPVNFYHPRVNGNLTIFESIIDWKKLNLVLQAGAEVMSLFTKYSSRVDWFKSRSSQYGGCVAGRDPVQVDICQEADSENAFTSRRMCTTNEILISIKPYLEVTSNRRLGQMLHRILLYAGNISWDSQIVDSEEDQLVIRSLTGKVL